MEPHEILTIVCMAASVIVAIIAVVIGTQSNTKRSRESESEAHGVLMTEVGYIKAGIDDLKQQFAQLTRQYNELRLDVNALKAELKTIWVRIDELKEDSKNG